MLRTMFSSFEKIVEHNKKVEQNLDDQQSAGQSMQTIRLLKKGNSEIGLSSEELVKYFGLFKNILDAFKKQIEFNFDMAMIEEQQEKELDLVSGEMKDKERAEWKELMKKEIRMNAYDNQLDRWTNLILVLALLAIGINYLVQYQSVDAISNQTQNIMVFSEQAAEIIQKYIKNNIK